MSGIQVKGMKTIQANLTRAVKQIKGRTLQGIRAATIWIEGESNENALHLTGALIGSSFSGATMVGGNPVGVVGYTIKYAAHAHDLPDSITPSTPGTSPKFLKNAAQQTGTILQIIKNRAKR